MSKAVELRSHERIIAGVRVGPNDKIQITGRTHDAFGEPINVTDLIAQVSGVFAVGERDIECDRAGIVVWPFGREYPPRPGSLGATATFAEEDVCELFVLRSDGDSEFALIDDVGRALWEDGYVIYVTTRGWPSDGPPDQIITHVGVKWRVEPSDPEMEDCSRLHSHLILEDEEGGTRDLCQSKVVAVGWRKDKP